MYGIVGASGVLGGRIAGKLLDRGDAARLFTREPRKLDGPRGRGAEVVRADLRHTDWMTGALDGIETLVLAAHGMVPPVRNNNPHRTDDRGNRRIIDAAAAAGVRRIIFVSVADAHPQSHVRFLRIKGAVEEHLKGSGCDHLIVRPTVFIETHAILLLAEPLRTSGKVQLFGHGRTPLNWVSADDVADFIVTGAAANGDARSVATIGGPDRLSRIQVLEIIEARLGRRATRRHMPPILLRLLRSTAGRVNPALGCLVDLALNEQSNGDGSSPPPLDWTGPTTVADVVERWVAAQVRT